MLYKFTLTVVSGLVGPTVKTAQYRETIWLETAKTTR